METANTQAKAPRRKAARSVEAKQAKREEILRGAIDLFVRKGFFAGSMNELARELGVAKGTLYVYFESKETLWLAIVEQITEEIGRQLEPIFDAPHRPLEKIERLARAIFEFYAQNLEICSIMIKIWASTDSSLEADMGEWMRRMYGEYRERLAAILRDGIATGEVRPEIEPLSAASFVLALLDGLIIQWLAEPVLFNVEKCVQAFRQVCLVGLAAGDGGS
jgi:AcrR family transcriptional regulator